MTMPNLKSKIFGEGFGRVSHLSMTRPNLKFNIFSEDGGGHLSISRPNLKFKNFGEDIFAPSVNDGSPSAKLHSDVF